MSQDIKRIQAQFLPILKKHQVVRASLFGSVLRADFKPSKSDIDLLVEFSGSKSLFGQLKLKVDLEKQIGKSVDVVEFDALKPRIKDKVMNTSFSIL